VHPFQSQAGRRNFGTVESRTFDEKTERYKSNWLRQITRMNSNRMPKIILNSRPNGRRRLGNPLKRPLDEVETVLLRPNSSPMMMMMMMMMMMIMRMTYANKHQNKLTY
jgi:hypothetical protein